MFQPAAACPSCSQPNDEAFNFCQRFGYKRKRFDTSSQSLKKLKFTVDETAIAKRLADLSKARQSSPYIKQKLALEAELSAFIAALRPPKDLQSCRPPEMAKFLIWKDQAGRTKIHTDVCAHLGHKGPTNCTCPTRLAFGTVDSMKGKLRSIFAQNFRVHDWDPILGIGNPGNALEASQYLASIRSEQLQARVTPSQAKPFLLSHLELLCSYLHARLSLPTLDPLQVFILARDQAFFKALFFSGDRASDLANVKTAEILRLPDNSGFLFNHLWTKSLRNGDSNVFAFKTGRNRLVCPVSGIEIYFKIASLLKVDLTRGYLFRSVTKEDNISPHTFAPAAAQARLSEYGQALGPQWLAQRFTLHSFLGGAAVSLAVADVPLHEIMDHIGCKSSKQAMHYIKVKEVLNSAGAASKLANLSANSTEQFLSWNGLQGFT